MSETTFLRNKLLEATISNALIKEVEKGVIFFTTANSVVGTCDCYFSSNKLSEAIGHAFSLKNGICYSINYAEDDILFRIVLSKKCLNDDSQYEFLKNKYHAKEADGRCLLFEHSVCSSIDEETLKNSISNFFRNNFNVIENELFDFLEEHKGIVLKELHEGAPITVELTKYERNREARLLCIKHYGAKCAVCGFDFGEVYGSNFEGMIEVHHKIPLYEIKEDYIVDPINDLIPVCPNCHAALHSKKDGFYTVEELKELFSKN